MKQFISKTALTSMAILFLLGGTTAAFANSGQPISLVANGGVTNLGNQFYTVAGGQVAYAAIDGMTVNNAKISYGFVASQNGPTTSGYGAIRLTGTITGAGNVVVSGTFNLNDNAGTTQVGSGYLPFYLVSDTPNIQTTLGGTTTPLAAALAIENPYWNPFGAPIVIASSDNSIIIAATYSVGTIYWTGSQVAAPMAGTLGTTPATGLMTLTGNEFENLVAGTAIDHGQTSWSDMTPSSLNANGNYQGSDTIPYVSYVPNGPNDCSYITGIPGTCTVTGFQSQGTFKAGDVQGSYTTAWGLPAVTFQTTITATLGNGGQNGQGQNDQGQHQGLFGLLSSIFHY